MNTARPHEPQTASPLKPQDIAVALQLLLTPGATYAQLVHRAALLEFLGAGVAYAFPAEAGAESRGVPTAHLRHERGVITERVLEPEQISEWAVGSG